jgi:hypothetical protein
MSPSNRFEAEMHAIDRGVSRGDRGFGFGARGPPSRGARRQFIATRPTKAAQARQRLDIGNPGRAPLILHAGEVRAPVGMPGHAALVLGHGCSS